MSLGAGRLLLLWVLAVVVGASLALVVWRLTRLRLQAEIRRQQWPW